MHCSDPSSPGMTMLSLILLQPHYSSRGNYLPAAKMVTSASTQPKTGPLEEKSQVLGRFVPLVVTSSPEQCGDPVHHTCTDHGTRTTWRHLLALNSQTLGRRGTDLPPTSYLSHESLLLHESLSSLDMEGNMTEWQESWACSPGEERAEGELRVPSRA